MKRLSLILLSLLLCACVTTREGVDGGMKKGHGVVDDKVSLHEVGYFEFIAFNSKGQEIWREIAKNAIADEGEQNALNCWLVNTACATSYYVRLSDSTSTCSIAEADNLATASSGEPSGNGYAAQAIGRSSDWTVAQISSGTDGCTETNCYRATSTTETFSASGGSWGPVYCAFVATTSDNTGKLVSWAALSTGRTLASGESLQVTYKIVLQ